MRTSVRPDDYNRAIAKTCFNYLAYVRGPEFVLQGAFDPIRNYILGRSIAHDASAAPGVVLVDTRFVSALDKSGPTFVKTEHHVLGLFYDAPRLVGFATFCAEHTYVVWLGDLQLDERVFHAHEFVGDRATNRALDQTTIIERIRGNQ